MSWLSRKISKAKMSPEEDWIRRSRTIGKHMVWSKQDFYLEALRNYGLHIKGIPEIRCYFLQTSLRSLDRLDGAIAECGSRYGKSALYMLTAMRKKRDLYMFDSWEGLSEPLPGKDTIKSAYQEDGQKRLFEVESYEEIEERFAPFENVHLKRGWIPERFDEVKDERFCLLHVDVDLYQPTLDSLEFFWPRLETGGMVICDDYGSGYYPGARKAMDEFFEDKTEKPIELPQAQAFVVKMA